MRHITPCILIAATLTLSACTMDFEVSGFGKSDDNSSNNQDTNDSADTREAKKVIGTWEQEQGDGKYKSNFTASVTANVITVEWAVGSDGSESDEPLWIGTFDADKAAKGETVTSKKDVGGMDEVSNSMTPDTLDFKLEDDQLKFSVDMSGHTFNAELKKTSDEPKIKSELQNTDPTRSFEDNVLEIPAATIKITGHHVIDPGSPGNTIGKKPIIIFDFEMTNKTNKDLKPIDFTHIFTAIQDNDENSLNELNAGFSEGVDTENMMDNIKKGGTVKSSEVYQLDDLTTPVKLVAKDKYDETEVGSQTYKLEDATPMDIKLEPDESAPQPPQPKKDSTHSV